MSNKTIDQLPAIQNMSDVHLVGSVGSTAGRITFGSLVDNLKKELGYMVRVLEKCQHCGQWGAVMCACPSCGAPIDPKG